MVARTEIKIVLLLSLLLLILIFIYVYQSDVSAFAHNQRDFFYLQFHVLVLCCLIMTLIIILGKKNGKQVTKIK